MSSVVRLQASAKKVKLDPRDYISNSSQASTRASFDDQELLDFEDIEGLVAGSDVDDEEEGIQEGMIFAFDEELDEDCARLAKEDVGKTMLDSSDRVMCGLALTDIFFVQD
mmetsp:Transcript_7308/g.15980  ORF Transcript_7308/g.15980 Transcript_7308/m.15980 type:complete len:111 (-) Transcript_7308:252-584(-)